MERIKKIIIRNKWFTIALFIFLINIITRNMNSLTEKLYSSTINKWVIQFLSITTNIIPFSIGEFLYFIFILLIPFIIFMLLHSTIKGKFIFMFKKVLSLLSLIYILFMLLWGLNYNCNSIAKIFELEISDYTTQDLYDLNIELIKKANMLRLEIKEENDIMYIEGGYKSVFDSAVIGYNNIAEDYKIFKGPYGKPKPLLSSKLMLYTHITGFYFPFTSEANVNVAIPDLLLPATVLHEMAHQRGIASEAEANYLAYLTSTRHPDIIFQYSGTVLALIYTMSSLNSIDSSYLKELKYLFSDGLQRDLQYYNEFWDNYDTFIDSISEKVNDLFLKSNNQSDGIKSYGRMVELLLAHYKKYNYV